MIKILDDYYLLNTKNTSYCFRVLPTGQTEHLYYGSRIEADSKEELYPLSESTGFAPGNTSIYDSEHNQYSLENIRLELSSYGKGDIREPFVELIKADGSRTVDFTFDSSRILDTKPSYKTMPTAYFEKSNEDASVGVRRGGVSLQITMKDRDYDLYLDTVYTVFYDTDVISRMTFLRNESNEEIRIQRLLSGQLDMDGTGYVISTFNGSWAREMHKKDTVVSAGKHVNYSYTGTSSNRANPFAMVSKKNADEDHGECYGINLIYSGNHYECLEACSYDNSRLVWGINPAGFDYVLKPKDNFEAPEAVMTFSADGFNGISAHMHSFVREHIVRGAWKKKARPVLLNSWEAAYFNISESKLLSLAKAAKSVGCELFVMDDGWFGHRNDDSSSLGDWVVNKDKLPGGIEGIASKVNALGMDFGIWVEPEMVNEDSDLYRKHPEWVISVPGRAHSTGRNQMILDLSQKVVRDYIIESMSKVFSSGNISYVKWDMNRNFTDVYSKALSPDLQGEVSHRYVTGLYEVMKTLTERFPDILFEGCASGGNRFDLGILSYFPQIWASDDTDAYERGLIQNGYSYGYPQSVYTSHVSGIPNHQTLRRTPLDARFNVAAFGVLGYECNLKDATKEELSQISQDIEFYKEHRELFQFGQIYRSASFDDGNNLEWTVVSYDGDKAMAMCMQSLVTPNMPSHRIHIKGLNDQDKYHLTGRERTQSIKDFGDLVNTVSPVHVKQGSMIHDMIDRFYKLPGEKEDYLSSGLVFNNAGIYMTQKFAGCGLNDDIKHYQDFSSRIYLIQRV